MGSEARNAGHIWASQCHKPGLRSEPLLALLVLVENGCVMITPCDVHLKTRRDWEGRMCHPGKVRNALAIDRMKWIDC